MIEVTSSAIKEIERLQTTREQIGSYCRLEVRSGGCSGLYYTMKLTSETQADDIQYQANNLCFLFSSTQRVHLENLKLDYVEDLMGGTFRFDNPSATMTCRCGLSFA